jgi:DNA primase
MNADERELNEKILADTASFYHGQLPPEVRAYLLEERKIAEEMINRFNIGYAQGGLRDHVMNELHYPAEACIEAGVLKKLNSGEIGDYFHDRIIFPNLKNGKVVHLTGRDFNGSEPKYLHLPGPILNLFNEDALINREVIITEGPIDCITGVQYGHPTVAIYGSNGFKPEFVPRFSRCEIVYICLDGDSAGERGALRIGESLGKKARIIQLPEGIDLNEYFKTHSREDFSSLISNSKGFVEYLLSKIPQNTIRTELPIRLEPILKVLSKIDEAESEAYLRHEMRPRFELKREEIDAYRRKINKLRRVNVRNRSARAPSSTDGALITARFDGLVDLIEYQGKVAFLIKEGDQLSIRADIRIDGKTYYPPKKVHVRWLLPRGEQVLRHFSAYENLSPQDIDGELCDALIEHLRGISELPDDAYYELIAAWVIHTYLQEYFQYSPVLIFIAVPERGKTRTGKVLAHLSYRGIHVESLREAYIFRLAENFAATIFFDVMNLWKKAEKSSCEDILLHRYEKGASVARVLFPEKGPYKDTVYYEVFGPTIIATNENIHKILETRAISIIMPQSTRRFENDVTPEMSRDLKERLVAFKARHMGITIPEVEKPASGRLGDILKPIRQVIRLVKPDREEAFLHFVRRLEKNRLFEKSTSFEAEILKAISRLDSDVVRGILPVKSITDYLNRDRPEQYRISYQRVGRQLTVLGFSKGKTANGAVGIHYNDGQIVQLMAAYGLVETPETSETPDSSRP